MALTCVAQGNATSSGAAIGASSKSFAGVAIGAGGAADRYILVAVACAGGTFAGISNVTFNGVGMTFVDEQVSTAATKTSVSIWIIAAPGAGTTATIVAAVAGGTMQACAVETFRLTGYLGFYDITKSTSDSPMAFASMVTDDDAFAIAVSSGIKASATISATWSGMNEQADQDVNYVSGHMGFQIGIVATTGAPVSATVTYVAGMSSTSMAGVAFSFIGKKDATVAGDLKKVTGAASVTLKENVTLAGNLNKVTGAVSVTQKENITIAGTTGRVSGAASVTQKENVTLAGNLNKVTGAVSVTQKENITLAGILGAITGAASVQELQYATLVGTLGRIIGSGSVVLSEQVTVSGVLGHVSGDIAMDVTIPSGSIVIDGNLGQITGAASVALTDELALVGTLARVTGAGTLALTDQATIAGTLRAVNGDAIVSTTMVLTAAGTLRAVAGAAVADPVMVVEAAGTLRAVTGSGSVSLQDNIAVDGALAAVVGAASVQLKENITIGGTLASVVGSVSVALQENVTLAGLLGPVVGAAVMRQQGDTTIAGLLGRIIGAATVSLQANITVHGTLGQVAGAVTVALRESITVHGTLGQVAGTASIEVTEPSTTTEPASTTEPTGTTTTEPDTCYDVDADARERILARLEVLLGTMGIGVMRNDVTIPESTLPTIVLLDGDETVKEETFGRGRPANGPNIVSLIPELYITVAADTPEEAGARLSVWEAQISAAVLNDATLIGLVHNKSIRYIGNEMGVTHGRQVYGQMKFEFAFDYALRAAAPCVPITYTLDGTAGVREQILEALVVIAGQTEGVASVARNDATVPEDPEFLPRVLVFDGSEASDSAAWYRGRPPAAPNRIRMEPEIYIMLKEGDDPVGSKLNQIRYMLLRGLLTDATLRDLACDGDIRYEGCQTALAAGRSLTGEMGLIVSVARVG